ncbi:MAG: hypothetical protein N2749_02640 [Clostridia bacterium]|nr:hypothetical protein [Clostridia bacterium]
MEDPTKPIYNVDGERLIVVATAISIMLAEKLDVYEQGVIGNLLELIGQNLLVIQAVNNKTSYNNSIQSPNNISNIFNQEVCDNA